MQSPRPPPEDTPLSGLQPRPFPNGLDREDLYVWCDAAVCLLCAANNRQKWGKKGGCRSPNYNCPWGYMSHFGTPFVMHFFHSCFIMCFLREHSGGVRYRFFLFNMWIPWINHSAVQKQEGESVCVGTAVAASVSKPLNSKEKTILAICYSFDAVNKHCKLPLLIFAFRSVR